MAIEGSVMMGCLVRVQDGELVDERWQQRHRDTLVHKPADALAKLLEGKPVWMRATDSQWVQLKQLWDEHRKSEGNHG